MNKILLATRNLDKKKLTSTLLAKVFQQFTFESLKDVNQEIKDKEETGDVINRAKEKAKNVFDHLAQNDYSYIVGIDDSIKMKGKIIENVKDYVHDILFNHYLEKDEIVYILRAYSFINPEGKEISVLTEIPFSFQPLQYEFTIKENTYPLSHVLSPIDHNIVVSKMSEDEATHYYLKYSLQKLEEVKNFFETNN